MITAEEVEQMFKTKELTEVVSRDCSICGFTMRYEMNSQGIPFMDTGCDCVTYSNPQINTWEEVAKAYNFNLKKQQA